MEIFFFQFVEDRVWLLECSPASCLTPWNHCQEKHEEFMTRGIYNKSPSHFSFDTGTLICRIWKTMQSMSIHLGEWKVVSVKGKSLCLKDELHCQLKKSFSRNSESILITHLSISRAKILRNKDGVFVPNVAIFNPGKKFYWTDSDHVLGNHFWAVSQRHTIINKTML